MNMYVYIVQMYTIYIVKVTINLPQIFPAIQQSNTEQVTTSQLEQSNTEQVSRSQLEQSNTEQGQLEQSNTEQVTRSLEASTTNSVEQATCIVSVEAAHPTQAAVEEQEEHTSCTSNPQCLEMAPSTGIP